MNREIAPHLYLAVEYIINDQGDLNIDVDTVVLPSSFDDGTTVHWALVNKFLGTLSSADLGTFCVGDQDDMLAIVERCGADGEYAHNALDLLFEQIGG